MKYFRIGIQHELTSGKKMKGYHVYHCNELETNNDFDIWWMEWSS
jgi:hypothetical protein